MKPTDRKRLTEHLAKQVARIAADLRGKMLAPGASGEAARLLHQDEQVGEDFEVWTDLLSRRAAVLWVLKSVYVRVLEDRGLVAPGRLLDSEAQQLFERLAPHLGETAFLRWIYRDLASKQGGLPELFSPQPAEVALPSDELSRALIAFWRHRDPDTGACWSFAEEHFEGELMGDLYQELDPVVKARYALCQTPDFVRAFMLDRTLTPAIATFGADQVRLLDPSVGSGHLLIDGLKRLFAATLAQHPEWTRLETAQHALGRVVGIDINDYACGLARARLVMTAAELAEVGTLAGAGAFHPHIYWADGLEQVEREVVKEPGQPSLFDEMVEEEKPRAMFTRSDVRAALKKIFAKKFHAVVANPPYITEKDPARKEYHRELIGNDRRYVSAAGKYSLASPFTERCFQLAEKAGYVGIITSNNFMKREFGKPLIERILANLDLTLVVDTSQAYIPYHGTPTVLLFGRNRKPSSKHVRAVMGKRGESGIPEEPAKGRVWSSIQEGWDEAGFENEYVSVADLTRDIFSLHPWSLGGGGASELKDVLDRIGDKPLSMVVEEIGVMVVSLQDDVFFPGTSALSRNGLSLDQTKLLVVGDDIRDWAPPKGLGGVFPYMESLAPSATTKLQQLLWPWMAQLKANLYFGKTKQQRGMQWWEFGFLAVPKLRTPLSIAFAFVATHNHFVLDRGGKVFNRSAPIIKLSPGATEDDHLALLGLLNSSTACFWMKQVFHNKGASSGGTIRRENWEPFIEFDSTKMKLFPVTGLSAQVIPYARRLDELARTRAERSVAAILSGLAPTSTAPDLREALGARCQADLKDFLSMVALQEELDWLCYHLYGLDEASDVVPPEALEPLAPTALPWVLTLAAKDAAVRVNLAQGETSDELPTEWFSRHRWEPLLEPPAALSASVRSRIEARRARAQANPDLALVETANFKRRWYKPDYDAEEQEALQLWIADRVEAEAKTRTRAFTLEQLTAALQDDHSVLAVGEVLTGRQDFSLSKLVAEALQSDAMPNHRFHLYNDNGLVKREVWERTWADQRREDAGEEVTPQVPPAYDPKDFLRPEHYQLRGKLDVPKERFVTFSEVPGRAGLETLYGWAGWTPLQRLRAILAMDEDREDAGVPIGDRTGLLDSAWRLLPEVAREDPAVATRMKAELQALVGPAGPSRELLEDWRGRFPPPRTRAAKNRRAKATVDTTENQEVGAL